MMQSPPPYVPVVEYILKALEHPPFMYVSKLAACCTILFLTRENPELLQELCHKWALRFGQDRAKLTSYIRSRASYCLNTPDVSTELEISDKINGDEVLDTTDGESSGRDRHRSDGNEEDVLDGIHCCDPDTAVQHLLSILNTLLPVYFSWNWHRADYVIQINKEYEAYVREFILPVCTALAPEEGVDDNVHTPWLLPPHTYLKTTKSASDFATPTSGVSQFPQIKAGGVLEGLHGVALNGGGIPSSLKPAGVAAPLSSACMRAPSELEGLGCSTMQMHFAKTPLGRTSAEHHAGIAYNSLPKFSLHQPLFNSESNMEVSTKSTSPVLPTTTVNAAATAAPTFSNTMQYASSQASGSGSISVPIMSPNVMSAGAFNTAAVYGLRFLSLGTYRAALRHNTRGLVTVFHAKYSIRSNEVIEVFQKITAKRLLNPMPTIAVVYAVAEPELSTLYEVSWFPTIVYTPPLPSSQHPIRSVKNHALSQPRSDYDGIRNQNSVGVRPKLKFGHHRHPHRHHRQRFSKGSSVAQSHSTSSRQLSGSDSHLEKSPILAAEASAIGDGAALFEEAERATWMPPSRDAAKQGSRKILEVPKVLTTAIAAAEKTCSAVLHSVAPLVGLSTDKVTVAAATNEVLTPDSTEGVAAATPAQLSLSAGSQQDVWTPVLQPGVSSPLLATITKPPTPSELLFGISVNEMSPVNRGNSSSQHINTVAGSLGNSSFFSYIDDSVVSPTHLSPPVLRQRRRKSLQEIVQNDGHVIYPLHGDLTVPALVEWISSRGASVPHLSKLKDISTCLKSIRQEEKFKRYRELHSAVVTLRRLQGQAQDDFGNGCSSGPSPGSESSGAVPSNKSGLQPSKERPLFIFLGGGMAAGKTTAVAALAKSSWWQGHKEQSVVVNADEFKLPLDCELSSDEAHKHSTRAAENLLVKAVNQGRSIVLDGTMMWKPFVQQVVSMIREAHLTLFKQGVGYDRKTKVEQYFLPDRKRDPALPFPYKIVFLGITVDVETAVPRGFLRKFSSNRGVPISMQLRSFKLFSKNFTDYVAMMDETTLYNNNVFVNLEKGELPPVMAECNEETGNKLLIHDEAAFQQFMKQQQINENAKSVMEVYHSSPVTSTVSM
ncbi:hypothetical protein ABL78_0375 [Leptomonas seymouri]|uniref:Zeta toxin domain-containing protein n=1 Tax=Leptomonas seymouri TaxID=5684 RepID=A0A0N1I3N6_LEPSE|nr:hypothetical protein ABL78_0375 [Leptomonas seymouri]|eukprot:KPI90445.1 hypothetical protein ABL78_0375 [Leptomonas seymouri]